DLAVQGPGDAVGEADPDRHRGDEGQVVEQGFLEMFVVEELGEVPEPDALRGGEAVPAGEGEVDRFAGGVDHQPAEEGGGGEEQEQRGEKATDQAVCLMGRSVTRGGRATRNLAVFSRHSVSPDGARSWLRGPGPRMPAAQARSNERGESGLAFAIPKFRKDERR